MSEASFFKNYSQIFIATEYCISAHLIMPALVLIYSSIDSVSWVASDDENQHVNERFQTWVDKWMFQKYPLPCTSLELYAARCGILHTLTSNSKLNENQGVRQISYAWGTAQQIDLDTSIKLLEYPRLVAVHINDIFYSFKNGFSDFLETIENDKVRKELFIQKAGKHLVNIDISVMNEFLTSAKNSGE